MEEKESQPPGCKFDDWTWQLKNSITTREDLEKHIELTEDERKYFDLKGDRTKFRITPYYFDLVKKNLILRKCVIPQIYEEVYSNFESEDPLCEEKVNPVKCIVHKYPDRCLFLVTDFCSTKCRYCTRSRIIENDFSFSDKENWDEAIEYIKNHNEIRDVIISGGDPLTLNEYMIDYLLRALSKIEHVKIIRIGTKVPVVLPQRINEDLLEMLEPYWEKLFINIHFSHPSELTVETKNACLKLAKLGILLGSQTVLLKGINDDIDIMKSLMQGLLECKVIPRYLYQMDKIKGGSHFSVLLEKGKEIIRGIQGFTSGMACPKYVVDSEYGKIPVDIGYKIGSKLDGSCTIFKNYKGEHYKYYD
jgi:lysine 2,3-aminomutase